MGYLFCPEPPTPVPEEQRTNQIADEENQSKHSAKSAFLRMRDAFYANEYEHVQRVNKELGLDERGMKHVGNASNHSDKESLNAIPEYPKVEGPVLIEFETKPEDEDDDDSKRL
ncbi:hypothetical protein AB6A40_009007 [Gnathostoma spinigerum]|uniref:Uncharacterized protein n=1 Tax=Gnathostoma spinigerum TaxID=75299 RepID=A0ABD6EQR8_9BILA